MATLRTSLFSTLAIAAFASLATAQDCTHSVDGFDTFGDGWNGAALDVNNTTTPANSLAGFTVAVTQATGQFLASTGDSIDTVYTNGTFDAEVIYSIFGGDGTVGNPTACNFLGGEDGTIAVPVGLTGLTGDCAGAGACPPPPPTIPANDDCTGAIDLGGAYQTVQYDMLGATDGALIDYTGFCDFGAFGDESIYTDLWYIFTPDNSGCHYISVEGTTNPTLTAPDWDTRLAVHESSTCPVDGSTVIACVDDEIQPIVGPFAAGLDVSLSAGTQYYIQLGSFEATTPSAGTFEMLIADGAANTNVEDNDPGMVNVANPSGCPVQMGFPESCNGDGGDQMGCTDCPCGNNSPQGTIGGCLNSAGTSARLIASGTPTETGSNMTPPLRFECSGVSPMNSAQLTSGSAAAPANAMNPCFGLNSGIQSMSLDGLRCAVQGVLRHGVRPSDANGDVGVTTNGWGGSNNLFGYDGFTAGQTRYFQVIHRDDASAVCLTGQNTTQLIEVLFEM